MQFPRLKTNLIIAPGTRHQLCELCDQKLDNRAFARHNNRFCFNDAQEATRWKRNVQVPTTWQELADTFALVQHGEPSPWIKVAVQGKGKDALPVSAIDSCPPASAWLLHAKPTTNAAPASNSDETPSSSQPSTTHTSPAPTFSLPSITFTSPTPPASQPSTAPNSPAPTNARTSGHLTPNYIPAAKGAPRIGPNDTLTWLHTNMPCTKIGSRRITNKKQQTQQKTVAAQGNVNQGNQANGLSAQLPLPGFTQDNPIEVGTDSSGSMALDKNTVPPRQGNDAADPIVVDEGNFNTGPTVIEYGNFGAKPMDVEDGNFITASTVTDNGNINTDPTVFEDENTNAHPSTVFEDENSNAYSMLFEDGSFDVDSIFNEDGNSITGSTVIENRDCNTDLIVVEDGNSNAESAVVQKGNPITDPAVVQNGNSITYPVVIQNGNFSTDTSVVQNGNTDTDVDLYDYEYEHAIMELYGGEDFIDLWPPEDPSTAPAPPQLPISVSVTPPSILDYGASSTSATNADNGLDLLFLPHGCDDLSIGLESQLAPVDSFNTDNDLRISDYRQEGQGPADLEDLFSSL